MTIEIYCIKVKTEMSQPSLCASLTTWISVDPTGPKILPSTLGVHNIYHLYIEAEITMDSQRE